MTPQIVEVDGRRWRLLPETPPAQAARAQALARAQLFDELTDEPPPGRAVVVSHTPGARPAAGAGGHVGLSGRPAAMFPAAWPLLPPFPRLALEAQLPPFLPVTLDTDLVAQPDWPDAFLLHDFLQVALHRRPTLLSGRVASRTTGPVAGAAVEVTELWTTFAALGAAGLAPNALSLRAGLYADRPAGGALRRRSLILQAPARTLMRHAHAGDTVIHLPDRQGLVIDRPLAIEPGDPEREEYILIAAIDTGAADDLPATVTLAHPLARAHDAGAAVHRTTFAAAGPANAMTRAGRRGDLSLFVNGLNGIAPANPTIQVTGGGAAAEYHGVALWRTTTDGEGAFRLPPIHRVAHLRLRASGGGQPVPVETIVSLTSPGEAAADLLFP